MTPLRAALLVAIALSLMFALWRPSDGGGVVTGFEGRTLDARFLLRGPVAPPDSVAILAIDDATLRAYDAFPLPRDALALALRRAQDGGARAIAFDLLLAGQGQGDAAFIETLARDDKAVLAVSFLGRTAQEESDALMTALARSALPLVVGAPAGMSLGSLGPRDPFAENAWMAHVNVQPEADGALRRVPLLIQPLPGLVLPVLPLQAARVAQGEALSAQWGRQVNLGPLGYTMDGNNEVAVNFHGPEGTIQTTSLADADQADLEGRIVFIGASAIGYGDRFATPFDRAMPGVEVLANLAANLVSGNTLRRDDVTWGIDVILALLLAFAGVLAAAQARPAVAVAMTGALWVIALGTLYAAFVALVWLDGTTLLVALLTAGLCGGSARLVLQRRAALNLARYQSPILKDVLAQDARPAFDGRMQEAAVLFVDVVGFTRRSELLGPEATTGFLRRFHDVVERAATDHSGLVEQFVGDGGMICFGLPEPSEHDAENALNCAEALFAGVADMNAALQLEGQPPVVIRIGAHFGQVAAAVLGGARQGHVTFVGDVVNATSRLQDVAKDLGAELVVSDALKSAVGNVTRHRLSSAGHVDLRGRDAGMQVWIRPGTDHTKDRTTDRTNGRTMGGGHV